MAVLGGGNDVPVLKQRIFRWFPSSGLVSANTVGEKNMASSSGCAIKRQMRLLRSLGKEREKGDEVEEMVQKRKTAAMAIASAVTLNDGDIMKGGSRYQEDDSRSNVRPRHDLLLWSVAAHAMATFIMTSVFESVGNFLN